MPPIPPLEETAWRRHYEAMLLQHRVDIERLWRRMSQSPQDWAGSQPHPREFDYTPEPTTEEPVTTTAEP